MKKKSWKKKAHTTRTKARPLFAPQQSNPSAARHDGQLLEILEELSRYRKLLDSERRNMGQYQRLTLMQIHERNSHASDGINFKDSDGVWTLECWAGNHEHRMTIVAKNYSSVMNAYGALVFGLALAIHHYRLGLIDGAKF